jgi:hypothetical protein
MLVLLLVLLILLLLLLLWVLVLLVRPVHSWSSTCRSTGCCLSLLSTRRHSASWCLSAVD